MALSQTEKDSGEVFTFTAIPAPDRWNRLNGSNKLSPLFAVLKDSELTSESLQTLKLKTATILTSALKF